LLHSQQNFPLKAHRADCAQVLLSIKYSRPDERETALIHRVPGRNVFGSMTAVENSRNQQKA
jgi:hypothetical protein